MNHVRGRIIAPFLIIFSSGVALAQPNRQNAPAADVLLTIGGEVERPLKLTAGDLAKLPRRSVKARDHDGKEVSFEGVEVGEVLKLAGSKFGEQLRGKDLKLFLLVEAADGYGVVFALPELLKAHTDRLVLLADVSDGKPLPESQGKLRVIVPDEKHQSRWVRQVIALTVRRAD